MPEISETPIDQFTSLAKIPQGEFPALMGGDQSVAEVIDSSTGRPVLTGAVASSHIVGSQIWAPVGQGDQSQVRMLLAGPATGRAGLFAAFSDTEITEDDVRNASFPARLQFIEGTSGTRFMIAQTFVSDVNSDYKVQASFYARNSGETGNPPGVLWVLTDNGNAHSFEVHPNNVADSTTRLKRVDRIRELVQAGSVTATTSGGAGSRDATATITFPEEFTASPLSVTATTDDRLYNAAIESVSSTQATVAVSHIDGTAAISNDVLVYWTAVGPRA